MSAIESYITALDGQLKVARRARVRILAETEDHLMERAALEEARGLGQDAAGQRAIAAFGSPHEFAANFVFERATRAVRRAALLAICAMLVTVLIVVATGASPPLGTSTLLILAPYATASMMVATLYKHRRAVTLRLWDLAWLLIYASLCTLVVADMAIIEMTRDIPLTHTLAHALTLGLCTLSGVAILQAAQATGFAHVMERATADPTALA
jgi:membrane-associated HD superfamily phosphohydrolase